MKLTKGIMKELGYKYSRQEELFYEIKNPSSYIYKRDLEKVSLKEFVEREIQAAYCAGKRAAQHDIRKAIGCKSCQ